MLTELVSQLKSMHLYGMASALSELHAEKPRHVPTPESWLKRLIDAEQVDRKTSSIRK